MLAGAATDFSTLFPAECRVGLNRRGVLDIDIQLKRATDKVPRDLQQTAANAAEPPVTVNENMRNVRLALFERQKADNACIFLFRNEGDIGGQGLA